MENENIETKFLNSKENYYFNKCKEISSVLGKFVIILFLVNILILSMNSCFKKEILPIIQEEKTKTSSVEKKYKPIEPSLKEISPLIENQIINPKPSTPVVRLVTPQKVKKKDSVNDAVHIIKKFEGFSKRSYRCPGNKISIGYGFDKRKFKRNKISQQKATEYLTSLVKDLDKYIDRKVKVKLTHGQKVALISFVYNVGKPRFENSTMLKYINSGKFKKASKEFDKWVYCKTKKGKTKLKGLSKRRTVEKNIFLS